MLVATVNCSSGKTSFAKNGAMLQDWLRAVQNDRMCVAELLKLLDEVIASRLNPAKFRHGRLNAVVGRPSWSLPWQAKISQDLLHSPVI